MNYIGFAITSLVYIVIFLIIYFSKERISLFENKLLIATMVCNVIGLLLELSCYWAVDNIEIFTNLKYFVLKSYVVYIAIFNLLLNMYIFILTNKKYGKREFDVKEYFKKIFLIFGSMTLILSILIYIFPIYIYNDGTTYYTYGLSIKILFASSAMMIGIWIYRSFTSIIYRRKQKLIKYYVILIGILLMGTVGSITQFVDPSILLLTSMHSLILTIIYFTIENPDLKMLREFQEAKEYAEKSNNEKTMFLFDMSQKIKVPVTRILRQSENIMTDDNMESIVEEANDIKYYSKKLLQMIDNVLDISALERYDFKLINTTYNIQLLLKEIEIMSRKSIIEKDIEFRSNISSSLPSQIYGDSIRLKQIINIIMNNAIKYTDKGFIELTVNSVIKHDVCRLIITIEDSGKGMTNEEIEDIFDKERIIDENNLQKIDTEKDNLAVANSLAKIIGGTIMVSSEIGKGSSFTIVLDQKISNEYKTETMKNVEEYTEQLLSNKKIMVVGCIEEIKKIEKQIKSQNIEIEYASMGIDCLKEIRNGKSYDLIVMEEDMDKLDGMTVYKKLKEIEEFETPVILIGEENNNKIINKYKEQGIKEYISLPIEKEKVNEIIKNMK